MTTSASFFCGSTYAAKSDLRALDGILDLFQGPAALAHVALDLPSVLDRVRDVEVDLEVKELLHALVEERVQAFNDQDLRGLDLLRRVEEPGDVVVDRLLDGVPRLEGLDLLVHEVEVLGLRGKRGHILLLAAIAVEAVVIV